LRLGGGGGDAEEGGYAVCVLEVEGCARGVVFEGAVGRVSTVSVYGTAEGDSLVEQLVLSLAQLAREAPVMRVW
jgi:hypothetical protein